jgi:adenylate cyclase
LIDARRLLSAFLIGQAACMLAAALYLAGALERLDLIAYDQGIRLRTQLHAGAEARNDRIVLITVREADIATYGWPLDDGELATLLEILCRAGPRAIGVDIFRDRPVPPGTERLDALLGANPAILWGYLFGTDRGHAIPSPAVLGDDRSGFIDVIADRDGVVRRGILYMHDAEEQPHSSLPLMLASRYLEPLGIAPVGDELQPDHLRLGRTTLPPLEPADGPYADIDAQGYQYLLDYAQGARPYETFSIAQALAGEIPPQVLAGRLILVAVTAESVKDLFKTPLADGDTAAGFSHGVTLHAQATGQLLSMALDGTPPLRGVSLPAELIGLWLVGMAGSLAGLTLRGSLLFGAAALGGMAALAGMWFAAFEARFWLPFAAPTLIWLATLGLVAAYLSRLERAERATLMHLFSSHLSEPVAQDIWRQRATFMMGGRPKPQRLTATVLFSDIAGFSTISERLDPEVLTGWLDRYMDAMSRTVLAHDGIVLRFIGDAILAVFGVPVPRTDEAAIDRDAAQAVRCALAMARELEGINESCRGDGLPPIAIRVGIHTGAMVAGSMGTADHLEYSLVGDSVNTAARLEALSKQIPGLDGDGICPILVGGATWERLRGGFTGRLVGTLPLKGKVEPVAVYQVVGRTGDGHTGEEKDERESHQSAGSVFAAGFGHSRREPASSGVGKEES